MYSQIYRAQLHAPDLPHLPLQQPYHFPRQWLLLHTFPESPLRFLQVHPPRNPIQKNKTRAKLASDFQM
jgi:hypothetical protein